MMGFFTWLAGTKAGRTVTAAVAFCAALGLALLKAFSAGRSAEKTKQASSALDAVEKKVKSDETVDRLSADDQRERLHKWGCD